MTQFENQSQNPEQLLTDPLIKSVNDIDIPKIPSNNQLKDKVGEKIMNIFEYLSLFEIIGIGGNFDENFQDFLSKISDINNLTDTLSKQKELENFSKYLDSYKNHLNIKVEQLITELSENSGIPLVDKLGIYKKYIEFQKIDNISKVGIIGYLDNLNAVLLKKPSLEGNSDILQAVGHLEEQINGFIKTGKLEYKTDISDKYKIVIQKVLNESKSAREAIPVSVGLEDGIMHMHGFKIDDKVNNIDEEIYNNLHLSNGEKKSAEALLQEGLNLKIDINNDKLPKDLLNRYIDRLNGGSIDELKKYYDVDNEEAALESFSYDIESMLSNQLKDSITEVKNQLKNSETTVTLFGNEIIFDNLQEKNYALTSLLLFIKGFAEDEENYDGITGPLYLIGEGIGMYATLGIPVPDFIGDYDNIVRGTLTVLLVSYHMQSKLAHRIPTKGNNALKKGYIKAINNEEEYTKFIAENPEYKERANILKSLKEGLEVEIKNGKIPKEILDDLLNFEKNNFTIKNENMFYSKLFKTIYRNKGGMSLLNKVTKLSVIPAFLGAIEDTSGSTLRGTKANGFTWIFNKVANFKIKKLGTSFDIMGAMKGSSIDLGEIEGSFKYAITGKDGLLSILSNNIKLSSIDKIFKEISLEPGEKNTLMKRVEIELKDVKLSDNEKFEKIKTKYSDLVRDLNAVKDSLSASDDYNKPVNDRINSSINDGDFNIKKLEKVIEELLQESVDIKDIIKGTNDLQNSQIKSKIKLVIIDGLGVEDYKNNAIKNIKESLLDIAEIDKIFKNINGFDDLKTEFLDNIGKGKINISEVKSKIEIFQMVKNKPTEIKSKIITALKDGNFTKIADFKLFVDKLLEIELLLEKHPDFKDKFDKALDEIDIKVLNSIDAEIKAKIEQDIQDKKEAREDKRHGEENDLKKQEIEAIKESKNSGDNSGGKTTVEILVNDGKTQVNNTPEKVDTTNDASLEKVDYQDRLDKLQELKNSKNELSRLSITKAPVVSISIVDANNNKTRISFDITAKNATTVLKHLENIQSASSVNKLLKLRGVSDVTNKSNVKTAKEKLILENHKQKELAVDFIERAKLELQLANVDDVNGALDKIKLEFVDKPYSDNKVIDSGKVQTLVGEYLFSEKIEHIRSKEKLLRDFGKNIPNLTEQELDKYVKMYAEGRYDNMKKSAKGRQFIDYVKKATK